MYIPEFVCGLIAGVVIGVAAVIIFALAASNKKKISPGGAVTPRGRQQTNVASRCRIIIPCFPANGKNKCSKFGGNHGR